MNVLLISYYCYTFTIATHKSFATAVSEVTRSSSGSGGKGHVKSASVSSPGPSAENGGGGGGTPADPLGGPRYQTRSVIRLLVSITTVVMSKLHIYCVIDYIIIIHAIYILKQSFIYIYICYI